MRGPIIVAVAVAVAGAVFVVVYEPSPAASRVHDWLAVVFVAATAGLFYAAGTAPRRRFAMVSVAYALFVATVFAWLAESAAVWAVLAAAVAAAVEAARRLSRSAAPR
jgi:hypothetical protein